MSFRSPVTLYTFYPQTERGSASTFEAAHLPGDAAANRHAAEVLRDHASARDVEIWCGDRFVGTVSHSDVVRSAVPDDRPGASPA